MSSEWSSGISARDKEEQTRRLSPNIAHVVLAEVYAYPAVVPRHIRIRKHLCEHRAQRRRTKRHVARGRHLELLAKEDGECRPLLGCGEGE